MKFHKSLIFTFVIILLFPFCNAFSQSLDHDKLVQYEEAVLKGEEYLQVKDYPKAKAEYQKALSIDPSAKYPKDKLALIRKFYVDPQDEVIYNDAVAKGNQYLEQKNFKAAKEQFQSALLIKPDDRALREKIAGIDQTETDYINKSKLYETHISNANKHYNDKKYNEALTEYKLADEILPGNRTTSGRIQEIESLLIQQKALDDQFTVRVTEADEAYMNRNYNLAISKYQQASALKPSENYPKSMIQRVKESMTDMAFQNKQDSIQAIKNAEIEATRLAEEARIAAEKQAEEERIALERLAEERKLEQERLAEEAKIAAEKKAEEERILAEKKAEEERILAEKKAEEERLARIEAEKQAEQERLAAIAALQAAEQRKQDSIQAAIIAEKEAARVAEEARIAAEKKAEEDRIAAERLAQEQKLEQERIAEEARIAAEKKAEEERLAKIEAEKQAENDRLAQLEAERQAELDRQAALAVLQAAEQRKQDSIQAAINAEKEAARLAEEARIAAEKKAEEDRLAAERVAEEQRLEQERLAEEARIAAEKKAEEDRIAAERLAEEQKLEQERIAEETRIAAAKKAEEDRIAAEQLAEQNRLAQIEAEKQAELDRLAALAALKDAEQRKQDSIQAAFIAEKEAARLAEEARVAAEKKAEADKIEAERLAEEARIAAEKKAEEDRLLAIAEENRRIEEEQKRLADKDYYEAIDKGNELYTAQDYPSAIKEYEKASELKPLESFPKERLIQINNILQERHKNNMESYNKFIAAGDLAFQSNIFDKAIEEFTKASAFRPEERYPVMMIEKIRKQMEDNAIVTILEQPTIMTDAMEQRFSFNTIEMRLRKNNYLILKARKTTEKTPKVFINYGKDGQKSGGIVMKGIENEETTDYLLRISAQDMWYRIDNNWISIYPEGGDIEITSIRISQGDLQLVNP